MDKDIMPAINLQRKIEEFPNELSEVEFQKRLFKWFEDRGLLSDLRAHLRKQMIGALKETTVGNTVDSQQKPSLSPKLQALNLMIAEFLLKLNYHYSLSVFSTEVPLISVIPQFPGISWSHCRTEKTHVKWQFAEKDMWDILETLGIENNTVLGKTIYNSYYKCDSKERDPLLSCVVKVIHLVQGKLQDTSSKLLTVYDGYEVWIRNICEILNNNNVKTNDIKEILNVIINVIENEKKHQEQKSQESLVKLQMKFQADSVRNEEELNKKWSYINNSLQAEKSKIQDDTAKRDAELRHLETKLQRQQTVLKDCYQGIVQREKNVHQKEHDLQKQQEYLDNDQKSVTELQRRLTQELMEKQIIAKHDAEFLKNLKNECKNVQNEIINSQDALLIAGENLELNVNQECSNKIINQLRTENNTLKSISQEQQTKIDELSGTAESLMRDLEASQTVIKYLSTNTNGNGIGRQMLNSPLFDVPAGLKLKRNEKRETALPTVMAQQSETSKISQSAKQYIALQDMESSDDNTPTSDVLQEVRNKLKRLEQESDEVDRKYKEFKMRQGGHFASIKSINPETSPTLLKSNEEINNTLKNNFNSPIISSLMNPNQKITDYNHQIHPEVESDSFEANKMDDIGHQETVKITSYVSNVNPEKDHDEESVISNSILNEYLSVGTSGASICGVDISDDQPELQSFNE